MNQATIFKSVFVAIGLLATISVWRLADVGRFQFLPISVTHVWRIDTRSGDLSLCLLTALNEVASCGEWGTKPLPANFLNTSRKPASHEPIDLDRLLGANLKE